MATPIQSEVGSVPADPPGRLNLRKRPVLLLLELFVAVSLSVNFFYLVRTQCLPKKDTGNILPATAFCWLSPNFSLSSRDLPNAWRTRLLAPAMSSRLAETKFDYAIGFQSDKCKTFLDVCRSADFQNLFGLYHAGWVMLTFLLLIVFRTDALLLLLGVFGGLMYNLIIPAGMYYYPWDMPTMFFFTLACLLFHRGWIWPLLPVVWVGGLNKETTLCCALFILLYGHWSWKRRVPVFVAVVLATLFTNHLLIAHYEVHTPLFTMNNARSTGDLLHKTLLYQNLPVLFSLHLNHVAFTNAGALLLMMLIPWRNRRDLAFKAVILAFALGQFLYGYIDEFRVWYELLPLGWILVSDELARNRQASAAGLAAGPASSMWVRSYWMTLGAILAVAVAGLAVVKMTVPAGPVETRSPAEVLRDKIAVAESGNVEAQLDLGHTFKRDQQFDDAIQWYRRAAEAGNLQAQFNLAMLLSTVRHDYPASLEWFRRAAEQGHVEAAYCLGVTCWNGMTGKPDYDEGFKWLLLAAKHGHPEAQFNVGRIFEHPVRDEPPNLVEAYKWLKVAELGGMNEAGQELKSCMPRMSPEQIAEAEAWVEQARRKQKQDGRPL